MRIGLLVSGHLGLTVLEHIKAAKDLVFVMSDANSDQIISFCQNHGISIFIGNPRNGKSRRFLEEKEIDVLISVNYLFLIDNDLILLPKVVAFNIHGSLLPKYRGRTPHVWAIINNEKEVGITAHLIDNGCDTGDIIKQIVIPVEDGDTGAEILKKFNALYIPLLDTILEVISNGELKTVPQEHEKATYFGKRTPEDGKIDWNWQKERIRNWVNAQADPYPGAFTFYQDKKIIIDRVSFSDRGFSYDMANGMITCVDPLLVKTPNGLLQIEKTRAQDIVFELNGIFS